MYRILLRRMTNPMAFRVLGTYHTLIITLSPDMFFFEMWQNHYDTRMRARVLTLYVYLFSYFYAVPISMIQKAKKRMRKHTLIYSISFKSTFCEGLLHLGTNTLRRKKKLHSPTTHEVHTLENESYEKLWECEMGTVKGAGRAKGLCFFAPLGLTAFDAKLVTYCTICSFFL